MVDRRIVQLCGRGDASAIQGGGGDGAGVHQADPGKLPLAGLVGEDAGAELGGFCQVFSVAYPAQQVF